MPRSARLGAVMPDRGSTRRRRSSVVQRSAAATGEAIAAALGLLAAAEAGADQHAARRPALRRRRDRASGRRPRTTATDRGRDRAPRCRSMPGLRLAAVARAGSARRRFRRDSADSSNSRRCARRRPRGARRCAPCASATKASRDDAAGDPRLVGDDHHGEAGAIEQPHRIDAVGKKGEVLEPGEIAGFFDQGAVAIEEDGAASSRRSAGARRCTDARSSTLGLPDAVDHLYSFHAAMIDRALAQQARAAEHVAER